MHIKILKNRYPNIVVSKNPIKSSSDTISFFEEPHYFTIPKADLSEEEATLLHTLFPEPLPIFTKEASQFWSDLLFGKEEMAITTEKDTYRITQFHIKTTTTKSMLQEWQKALLSFFSPDAELIMFSANYGVIIEKSTGSLLGEEELVAVASTLESDFYIQSTFFMGLFHPLNMQLRGLFAEERTIFNFNNREVVQTVASESLKVIARRMKESLITNELNILFHQDDTWIPLIHTLFKNQGNISLTAKELFMHRNTIQYRLDKFHEQTNLSLRKMDGLLLAYLATLQTNTQNTNQ
ncbi:PucR family transcriptional regulator [Listeria cossartiae subsp. cayugensis]|uniref:PucR family transcriptional regulator n=1 Tax=Listeria cossartiae TaxID=2838249 RepID=UPI0028804CB1|nr:PucR family transcriptional regulator [Listeria cossartiae]MDT0000935.1 PucR family transcriptional regulator [Listeria cossartiae subsp. cayugensis]MDT0008961.1 PucR family transcriptional regulator [Listeria cossartiae subsp. cayugensis]MDT0030793.1 PucR family transcriptional regulator [Listeria cossartiae subsp. cayugensis]MDT0038908.1 PucR family transcriptional regulator [Listeria cossartiae subsp. cayugensis]MDT0044432.1 PucR family transcriptional regulator [Listeria cossartiae subs